MTDKSNSNECFRNKDNNENKFENKDCSSEFSYICEYIWTGRSTAASQTTTQSIAQPTTMAANEAATECR